MILTTGSQAVLCTETSYNVPDIIAVGGSTTTGTRTVVSGNSTTIIIYGYFTTYIESSIIASATNATNSVGYIVTSTSMDSGVEPSGAWTVMTCTYLP